MWNDTFDTSGFKLNRFQQKERYMMGLFIQDKTQ